MWQLIWYYCRAVSRLVCWMTTESFAWYISVCVGFLWWIVCSELLLNLWMNVNVILCPVIDSSHWLVCFLSLHPPILGGSSLTIIFSRKKRSTIWMNKWVWLFRLNNCIYKCFDRVDHVVALNTRHRKQLYKNEHCGNQCNINTTVIKLHNILWRYHQNYIGHLIFSQNWGLSIISPQCFTTYFSQQTSSESHLHLQRPIPRCLWCTMKWLFL